MDISWNHKANNQIKKQNQQSKNTNLPKKKEIKQFVILFYFSLIYLFINYF